MTAAFFCQAGLAMYSSNFQAASLFVDDFRIAQPSEPLTLALLTSLLPGSRSILMFGAAFDFDGSLASGSVPSQLYVSATVPVSRAFLTSSSVYSSEAGSATLCL